MRTEEELKATFEELWQVAVDKDLVEEKLKPNISLKPGREEGVFAEKMDDGQIFFYPLFFIAPYDFQRFIVGHEIGHHLLGHTTLLIPLRSVNDLAKAFEIKIEGECEANVFAVRLIGNDAESLLRELEVRFEQTGKEKALSFLFAPISSVKDAVFSLKHRRNDFRNPLKRYRSRMNVPDYHRAVLVLDGKLKSCRENEDLNTATQ
ncbi:MAG: hypothetical protein AAB897_02710 [Patescibacteria group bacterium]